MGTYQVPRNVKGEGRILFIFSKKALLYSFIGVVIGLIFVFIFKIAQLEMVGYIILLILGVLGFIIGTFKMPETTAFDITKKTGGSNIDDVIKRGIKFSRNRKIYLYMDQKKHIDKKEADQKTDKKNVKTKEEK